MPLYRAQAIFPFFTNLPGDVIANQFHFIDDTGATDEAIAYDITQQLAAFYNTIFPLSADKPLYIDWTKAYVKVFNLSDPPPRVPYINVMALTTGTGASTVPTEVACVLSFHAAPISGVRFQRLYNRIFLGGLMMNAFTPAAADEFPRFANAFIAKVITAAEDLVDRTGKSTYWVQVSEATGVTAVREIVGGWVDNSPDTQRRRSVNATLRSPWDA